MLPGAMAVLNHYSKASGLAPLTPPSPPQGGEAQVRGDIKGNSYTIRLAPIPNFPQQVRGRNRSHSQRQE